MIGSEVIADWDGKVPENVRSWMKCGGESENELVIEAVAMNISYWGSRAQNWKQSEAKVRQRWWEKEK